MRFKPGHKFSPGNTRMFSHPNGLNIDVPVPERDLSTNAKDRPF